MGLTLLNESHGYQCLLIDNGITEAVVCYVGERVGHHEAGDFVVDDAWLDTLTDDSYGQEG